MAFSASATSRTSPFDATIFATVAVRPRNDPAGPTSALVSLNEGAPPVLELTIAQNCSSPDVVESMAVTGALCLTDPDPAASYDVTALAGNNPLPVAALSSYVVVAAVSPISGSDTMLFPSPAPQRAGAYSCRGTASVLFSPVAVTFLTPCWRCWLTLASLPFNLTDPSRAASINIALNLADTFAFAFGAPLMTSTNVRVDIVHVKPPPLLVWQPLPAASADTVAAIFGILPIGQVTLRQAWIEETETESLFDFGPYLILSDEDAASGVLLLSDLDGSVALAGMTVRSLFNVTLSVPLGQAPFAPRRARLTAGKPLASLPAKLLQVHACAMALANLSSGLYLSCSEQPTIQFSIRVVRRNQPVAIAGGAATVSECAVPGTVIHTLNLADADSSQNLAVTILNVTRAGPRGGDVSQLFASTPLYKSITVFDVSSNTSAVRLVRRGAAVVVAPQDALHAQWNLHDGRPSAFTLQLHAQDDASFNSSLLEAVPTSATAALVITVLPLVGAPPLITGLSAVPEGGLSIAGGDLIDIVGTSLGLPSDVIVVSLLSSVPDPPLVWTMLNCSVIDRLTHVRCRSPPGWGARLSVVLMLPDGRNATLLTAVSYIAPRITEVIFADSVSGSSSLPTAGTAQLLIFRGLGLAPLAPMSLFRAALVSSTAPGYSLPLVGCFLNQSVMLCPVPEGAGGRLLPEVILDGRTSMTPTLSFSSPSIAAVAMMIPVNGTASVDAFFFTVVGSDLGRDLSDLDAVEYAVAPLVADRSHLQRFADCRTWTAVNCSYIQPLRKLMCALDRRGYGLGFSVRLRVRGQESSWSEDLIAYPPRRLSVSQQRQQLAHPSRASPLLGGPL